MTAQLTEEFPHWTNVPERFWIWPNFTPREMACRHTGKLVVVPKFMDRLQGLRHAVARPFPVNSAYRSPEHPIEAAKPGGPGPHSTGRAVDIRCHGWVAWMIIANMRDFGFSGLGISQHAEDRGERFIHLDDLPGGKDRPPRPWVWTYGD